MGTRYCILLSVACICIIQRALYRVIALPSRTTSTQSGSPLFQFLPVIFDQIFAHSLLLLLLLLLYTARISGHLYKQSTK